MKNILILQKASKLKKLKSPLFPALLSVIFYYLHHPLKKGLVPLSLEEK